MNLVIGPEFEKFIDEQVKAGLYSSSVEALEAGIARLMVDRDQDILDAQDLPEIRKSLDQIARGETIDAKTLHADIRKRFNNR